MTCNIYQTHPLNMRTFVVTGGVRIRLARVDNGVSRAIRSFKQLLFSYSFRRRLFLPKQIPTSVSSHFPRLSADQVQYVENVLMEERTKETLPSLVVRCDSDDDEASHRTRPSQTKKKAAIGCLPAWKWVKDSVSVLRGEEK